MFITWQLSPKKHEQRRRLTKVGVPHWSLTAHALLVFIAGCLLVNCVWYWQQEFASKVFWISIVFYQRNQTKISSDSWNWSESMCWSACFSIRSLREPLRWSNPKHSKARRQRLDILCFPEKNSEWYFVKSCCWRIWSFYRLLPKKSNQDFQWQLKLVRVCVLIGLLFNTITEEEKK